MNKKLRYISSSTYDSFFQEARLDSLAYYLHLKDIYKKKAIFYDHTWSSLSRKTGFSVNTLKYHVNYFIEKGLAIIKDGHLHILNAKRKPTDKMVTIPKTVMGLSNIKIALRAIPVLCSFARQATKMNTMDKPDAIQQLNRKRSPAVAYLTLSNKKFAEKIDRKSISTVQRYKDRLRSMDVIVWRHRYATLHEWGRIYGNPLDVPHRIKSVDGELCVQLSNQYILSYYKKKPVEARYCQHSKVIHGITKESKTNRS